MAHNDHVFGGGGPPKTRLRKDEAAFFHRHHIPVPPGMRLPSGGGWQMSTLGYVVLPLPTGERFRNLVRLRRRDLTPEQQADPEYAFDSPTGGHCERRSATR